MNDLNKGGGNEIKDDIHILSPEASHRVAGIIKNIRGRFLSNGKKLAQTFLFQLHEMIEGKEISEDKRIITQSDLELLFYAPHIEKKETRRIIATIIYRTDILLAETDVIAAKYKAKLERYLRKKK